MCWAGQQVGRRQCPAEPAWWRVTRPRAFSAACPTEGRCSPTSSPRPGRVPSLAPEPDPLPRVLCTLTLSPGPPTSSLVIAVRVKEEHGDTAMPDKAPSSELPVSIENIKQETDD